MNNLTNSNVSNSVTESSNEKPLIASNNLRWTELKPTNTLWAPPSRSCHTAILFQHFMLIFGGKEGEGGRKYLNDIFIFNIRDVNWENSKITGTIPPARLGHTACLNEENRMILFGGWDGSKVLSDTWILTIHPTRPLTLEWQQMNVENTAPKRQFHTSNVFQNNMYIFGGGDGKFWGSDLYALNFKNSCWTLCDTVGEKPSGRLQHCSVLDKDRLYIFGGEPNKQQQLNDLHVLDISTLKWEKIVALGAPPIPRVSASAQKKGNKLFFFGGFNGQTWLKDTFAYNIDENSWETIDTFGSLPKSRCRHTMVVHENSLIIFGGNDCETSFSDIYSLDLEIKLDSNNSTLACDFRNLMNEKLFCDIVFQVEQEEIPAHKAILAARCEHFRTMFLSDLIESKTSKIRMNDIKPDIFKRLLEYIYCDQVFLNDELALELLVAANRYLLYRLKTLCEQYLSQRLSVKNIVEIINAAEMHEAELLKECSINFMLNNREAIIETQDLLKVSKSILVELYKRRAL